MSYNKAPSVNIPKAAAGTAALVPVLGFGTWKSKLFMFDFAELNMKPISVFARAQDEKPRMWAGG